MTNKFGPVKKEKTLLFIDEFQNYSVFEMQCIIDAFSDPVFNLFGDYDQRIEQKGLELQTNIEGLFSPVPFQINVNYRNARQITEYINVCVHKNMMPIGVEGKIDESSYKECLFDMSGRTAVVAKDVRIASALLRQKVRPGLINKVADGHELKESRISLLSVSEVKGLEFETVYVFAAGLTENEKYVAFTRALEHLVVITDENLNELLPHKKKSKSGTEEKEKLIEEIHGNIDVQLPDEPIPASEELLPSPELDQEVPVQPAQKTESVSEELAPLPTVELPAAEAPVAINTQLPDEQKDKIYTIALKHLDSKDIDEMTDTLTLLEIIEPYKNATEQICSLKEKLEARRALMANRRAVNRCQYCGGKFRGFFSKQCTGCGKMKDY